MTARHFKTILVLPLLLILLMSLVGCVPISQISTLHSPLAPAPLTHAVPTGNGLPQPTEGKAVIRGVMRIIHTDTPMVGVELYLANHIGSTPETPMYGMDPSNAPHAITDSEGRFVFKDISPGHYAIVLWNPFNSFLVRDPKTGLHLTIDAQPDQVYDVGDLYESLP